MSNLDTSRRIAEARTDRMEMGDNDQAFTGSIPAGTGGRIVFVSDRDNSFDIWTAHPDGSGLKQLTKGPSADLYPALSPDGSTVAFARSPSEDDACFTSPCVGTRSHIWVMNLDGSNLRQLTFGTSVYDSQPEWSRDGGTIVFTRSEDGRNPALQRLAQATNWNRYKITEDGSGFTDPSMGPNSLVLYTYFENEDVYWESADRHSPELRATDISYGDGSNSYAYTTWPVMEDGASPTWAPEGNTFAYMIDGWIAVGRCQDDCPFRARAAGAGSRWGENLYYIYEVDAESLTWSPDAKHIAFQSCRSPKHCSIWMVDAQRDASPKLMFGNENDYYGMPDWGVVSTEGGG